jgi:hypothetical protein
LIRIKGIMVNFASFDTTCRISHRWYTGRRIRLSTRVLWRSLKLLTQVHKSVINCNAKEKTQFLTQRKKEKHMGKAPISINLLMAKISKGCNNIQIQYRHHIIYLVRAYRGWFWFPIPPQNIVFKNYFFFFFGRKNKIK